MKTEKEKDEPNWKNILLFKCPHRNSCGDDIRNEENGNIIICCGDDLGGFNNEFAQCSKCRERDYGEFIDGLLGDAYEAGKAEAIFNFAEKIKKEFREMQKEYKDKFDIDETDIDYLVDKLAKEQTSGETK